MKRRQISTKAKPVTRKLSGKPKSVGRPKPVRHLVTTGGYGPRRFWVMRDGTKIRIKDMEDSHLLAAIALLEKQAKMQYDNFIDHPPSFQGEMAQFFAEIEETRVYSNGPEYFQPDIYWDLRDESERRGLSWVRKVISGSAKKGTLKVDFTKLWE